MVKHGVLSRHREHHQVVYRLTDIGKQDSDALLSHGDLQGSLLAAVEAIAARA
jgi:hypothetical protein